MTSPEGPGQGIGGIPDKRERLADVLRRLSQHKPAHNASEAHTMVEETFAAVEGPVVMHPGIDTPMTVNPPHTMRGLSYGNRTVLYDEYERHILFLGDNGSIEIRLSERQDSGPVSRKKATHPFADQKIIFEKAGADGRRVWDDSTS